MEPTIVRFNLAKLPNLLTELNLLRLDQGKLVPYDQGLKKLGFKSAQYQYSPNDGLHHSLILEEFNLMVLRYS